MPVYKDKKRGTWFYQITHKGRKIKRRGFKTKREAQHAESLMLIELKEQSHNLDNLTFDDIYSHYFEYIKTEVKPQSYYNKHNLAELHILPYFTGRIVKDIKSIDIINWKTEMHNKGYSYNYLSKIYVNLSAILKFAVDHYGLPSNPCRSVGNFKRVNGRRNQINYWTLDEFNQFIEYVDDITYRTFFFTLFYTGIRRGEGLALQWGDINLTNKTIDINKTYVEKTGSGWYIGSPKTPGSYRTILMPEILVEVLIEYWEWCKQFDGFNDSCYVFGFNRPLATTTLANRFHKAIQLSGVKPIRIHDFRHSHASLLINNGASILVVAQRLGHDDVKMTLDTYSHMFPSKEAEIIRIIDNLADGAKDKVK